MGGFVVVVPRRKRLDDRTLQRVLAASARRSPDGMDHVVTDDGVLLVQCGFANTPESVGDTGLRKDSSGQIWLAKRGHITNERRLREQLVDTAPRSSLETDADLMLAATLKWGRHVGRHVHGEYAFVSWDSNTKTLLVVRDHLGQRGCFVHDGPDFFVAASEPSQILAIDDVPRDIDEYALVDEISRTYISRDRTFYQAIRRPWPATVTVVQGASVTEEMYWKPTINTEPARLPPSHYRDEVFSALEGAVRGALRSPSPVMCELSGGLDSSILFGLAAGLRESEPSLPEIVGVSMVYPGMDCDESEYIESMLAKWPTRWRGIDGTRPADSAAGSADPRLDWITEAGARVVLQGHGGDERFASGDLPITRPFRPRGHPLQYVWAVSGASMKPFLKRVRRELIRPKIPAPLLEGYLRLRGSDIERPEDDILTLKARLMVSELIEESRQRTGAEIERRAMDELWDPPSCAGFEMDDALEVPHRFESRRPYFDFELVQLLERIPRATHVDGRRWRALQKEAFSTVLSSEVATRIGKAEFTAVRQANVAAFAVPEPQASPLVELGLVRAEVVAAFPIGDERIDSLANRRKWQLLTVGQLDAWVRHHHATADGPAAP